MSDTITIPSATFAGFYYPQIFQALLEFLRVNVPEITDENEFETAIQLLRAYALTGHLNNTHLDVAANELLVPTLRLPESLKLLLVLVGAALAGARPATAKILLKLARTVTSDIVGFVPALTEFSTQSPVITYESPDEDLDLDRTDELTSIFGQEQEQGGSDGSVNIVAPTRFEAASGAFTAADIGKQVFIRDSISGNSGEFPVIAVPSPTQLDVSGAAFVTETAMTWRLMAFTADFAGPASFFPWSTPVAQDLLFIGHRHILWHLFEVDVVAPPTGSLFGVWEYFDDALSTENPDSVTDLGPNLRFVLDTLIGGMGDATGARVIVEFTPTGASEEVTSIFAAGENRIETLGLLGQVSPSVNINDYVVRVADGWRPLTGDDGSESGGLSFAIDGFVNYLFPQTLLRDWQSTIVNEVEANWLRFRITSAAAATSPELDPFDISTQTFGQFFPLTVTQGDTIGPLIIGSSTGLAAQSFIVPTAPFIEGSQTIEVDEGGGFIVWTEVENFLGSSSVDRHYTMETNENDQGVASFGNGTNGKIPPSGVDNVRATWRVGADQDGNVGAGEITENSDGVTPVESVTNPRPATGFKIAEGSTPADLELQKVRGPAQQRVRNRGITTDDILQLALDFQAADGSSPVVRAFAREEDLGPKTIGLIVVGAGGTLLTADQREELDTFFNGDRFAVPPVDGVLLFNHELTVFNYEPFLPTINVVVTWKGGIASRIENALINLLNPTALETDGVTFVWNPGDLIALSRIITEVHNIDPGITNVVLNLPAADINLGPKQLPLAVATAITVAIIEP